MTHDEFLDLLNAALDERRPVDSDPALLARAAEDATCREMLEGYRALQEGLRQRQSMPAAAPSADFAQRILAQLHTTPVHLPDNAPSIPFYKAGTAAGYALWGLPLVVGLAAALMLAVWPLLTNSTTPEQPPVAVTPVPENPVVVTPPVVVPEEETPATPLPVLVREVEDHYLMLAQDTRASLSEVALLLPSPLTTASTETASANVWLNQVGEQIRPLKSSMSGAFDFLLESLPLEDPPAS